MKTTRRNHAFILPDALVAMLIGSILVLSAYEVLVTSYRSEVRTHQAVLACNAARQIGENIRHYRAAVIVNGTYSNATVFGSVPQLSSLSSPTASAVVGTWRNKVRYAVVTVQWKALPSNQILTRRVVTLFGPGGVTP